MLFCYSSNSLDLVYNQFVTAVRYRILHDIMGSDITIKTIFVTHQRVMFTYFWWRHNRRRVIFGWLDIDFMHTDCHEQSRND